jgi:WG containing repeat
MIRLFLGAVLVGLAPHAVAETLTYTALSDGTVAAASIVQSSQPAVGTGEFAYRFTLRDPHSGMPWPHRPYALSLSKAQRHKLPFVADEKGVYQGTTDDEGRTGVFKLPFRIADQNWNFRERFGQGPFGETFRLVTPFHEQPLVNTPYLITMCSKPVKNFRGYTDGDGNTAYTASPRAERLQIKMMSVFADDELPTRCDDNEPSADAPSNTGRRKTPVVPVVDPRTNDRFVLCGSACSIVDGTGTRVTEKTFVALQPFDGDLAVHGESGRAGAIDRAGKTVLSARHAQLSVLDHRFFVAADPAGKDTIVTRIYDKTGRRLFRLKGPAVTFDSWSGHLFYQQSECASSNRTCPYVFLDNGFKPIARFMAFERPAPDEPLARAGVGERQHGFIDASLRFVIPPVYWYAAPFVGPIAIVTTPSGQQSVIDRAGKTLVPPGRYKSLYLFKSESFVIAFRSDQPNCTVFIQPTGAEVQLETGLCGDDAAPLGKFGYALVRDRQHRVGTIDAQGKQMIAPQYESLTSLNSKYLVFNDNPGKPTAYGVVSVDGTIVLPFQPARIDTFGSSPYASPAVLRDLFVARANSGYGLMDLTGAWKVPPTYHQVTVFSPDLIALADSAYHYRFADGEGRLLSLESRYIGLPDPVTGAFWVQQCSAVQKADVHNLSCPWGLADRHGRIVIAARFDDIKNASKGLWHVALYDKNQKLWGVYDSDGVERIAPRFTELDNEAGSAATIATTASYGRVLIDENGRILAQAPD